MKQNQQDATAGKLGGSVAPRRYGAIVACLWFAVLSTAYAEPASSSGLDLVATSEASIVAYRESIQPLLENYCYGCHGYGGAEGDIQLDEFADDAAMLADRQLWEKVLKNVRSGVMPPAGEERPSDDEIQNLARWIKYGPFGIDPADVDPGRVTIHRLNRLEYRNTIRDLLGVEFNTNIEFPPDAAGMGLDNIAELLTMSPMMLEKYLDAALAILEAAYPAEPIRSIVIPGEDFRGSNNSKGQRLSFNDPPESTYTYRNTTPGFYRLEIELEVVGLTDEEKQQIAGVLAAQKAEEEAKKAEEEPEEPPEDDRASRRRSRRNREPEPQKPVTEAHFVASVQSGTKPEAALVDRVFSSEPGRFHFSVDQLWSVEPHKINFNVVMPGDDEPEQPQRFFFGRRQRAAPLPAPHLVIESLAITPQPTDAGRRYFPLETPPKDQQQLREYIRQGIAEFGLRAFRRPLDEETQAQLVDEIEATYRETKQFQESIKPAMAKMLCSPRFLFRTNLPLEGEEQLPWGWIDEYSLASRLSYFLWSSMPDDELLELAGKGDLRNNLPQQIQRMLADDRTGNFIENFSGQWLQTRNVRDWSIVESAILSREGIRSRQPLLTNGVRRAMEQEATLYFAHVLREDKSVLDFIDSDYTFLNAELAEYYDIPDVYGSEMRFVKLAEGSPRGGVITAGSTLLVTSTTNRTSPVKRGVFVLDNFLGIKPHDPPPDVPSVEAASAGITDHEPTFREMLELHRQDSLCASCHTLMDPIGLALDSFNAMGKYRDTEFDQPIDTSGQLVSGEEFDGVDELKSILREQRREDFYRCLTTKLMTYALGRGLDYYDTESVDQIVSRLEREDGKFSALLMGIIESSPFQKRRNLPTTANWSDSN